MGKVRIPILKMIKHTKTKGETLYLRLFLFQTKIPFYIVIDQVKTLENENNFFLIKIK